LPSVPYLVSVPLLGQIRYQDVKHFYSNEEKLRLYYYVSNFAINQPMLPVISDPGSEHPDPIPLP